MAEESPVPAHVARYVTGAPAEAAEFGFLIGNWAVTGARYDEAGAVGFRYAASWRAEYLHDRRMVLDDFTFLSPTGEELSSFVTLRTYAPLTGRWEFAGLAALEPGMNGQWNGHRVGEEMHLDAEIRLPDGALLHARERFFDIAPESFRWENHTSPDRATWRLTTALEARRVG